MASEQTSQVCDLYSSPFPLRVRVRVCPALELPICKRSRGQRSPDDGRSIEEKVIITVQKERRSGIGQRPYQSAHKVALESGSLPPSPFDPSGSERLNRMVCVSLSPDFWGGRRGKKRKEKKKKRERRRGMGEEKKRKQDLCRSVCSLKGLLPLRNFPLPYSGNAAKHNTYKSVLFTSLFIYLFTHPECN